MKQVNFYTIIDPYKKTPFMGGGPETYRQIINNIEECGFKVNLILPSSPWISPEDCNFFILQDIFNDPIGSQWFKNDQYLEFLSSSKPFIFSECAYTACTTEPYAINSYGTISYGSDLSKFSRQFMLKARLVLTTSPLHKSEIETHIGYKLNNAYCYLQEVDTSRFYNQNLKNRDIPYLYAGACTWAKGFDLVVKEYKDKGLFIAGDINPIPPEKMPEIYNRTKNFVHLPRWKEPFSRTVAEASLCGCKIIGNSNIGAYSYGKDLSNPNIYQESKEDFISIIKKKFCEND